MFRYDDIFGYVPIPESERAIEPWRPRVTSRAEWPPDYRGVFAWRIEQLQWLRSDPKNVAAAKAYYSKPEHAAEFIMDWMDTFDPRKKNLKWVPFVLFERQNDFIDWLNECVRDQENGLGEKCRDMGATWLACGWSVWAWLFVPGFAIGWGSRKEQLVDKLGDPDSIFEKMRRLLSRIPKEFHPIGLDTKSHTTYMKFINPENGATITGEAGANIGRGGRKSVYFKDESAHYEQPVSIEAALGDNTNVQIDISSVNGIGNPFYNRRKAGVVWHANDNPIEPGKTRVFIMDWRDHPEKTQEWYERRKRTATEQGMLANFAQEVERNYSAAVSNTLIPLEWIQAALDADKVLATKWPAVYGKVDFRAGGRGAALDVADSEAGDTNALAGRKGVYLDKCDEWGAVDVGVTARKAMDELAPFTPLDCQYDIIGMGSTVKAEYNRLMNDATIPAAMKRIRMVPWNAGGGVLYPFARVNEDDNESPINKDYFGNIKAQAWWSLRLRFWRVFQAVTQGTYFDPAEMIVLDGTLKLIRQIEEELAQPTRDKNGRLQMIVDKKPDGARSPNLADAIVMCYFPMPAEFATAIFGTYADAA